MFFKPRPSFLGLSREETKSRRETGCGRVREKLRDTYVLQEFIAFGSETQKLAPTLLNWIQNCERVRECRGALGDRRRRSDPPPPPNQEPVGTVTRTLERPEGRSSRQITLRWLRKTAGRGGRLSERAGRIGAALAGAPRASGPAGRGHRASFALHGRHTSRFVVLGVAAPEMWCFCVFRRSLSSIETGKVFSFFFFRA